MVFKRATFEVGAAVRETGKALERVGLRVLEKPVFKEPFSRHRTVMNLFDKFPVVENDVFVAPNATVVGRVGIDSLSSIWYGAVVRGDLNAVTIGRSSAIRERAVVSTTRSIEGHVDAAVIIGDNVIVGSGALLQSCIVENGAEIGAGAIVLEGAVVEAGSKVLEGSVVHAGRRIPAGQLWGGNPAVFMRDLSKTELAEAEGNAAAVAEAAREHAAEFTEVSTAFRAAEAL